MSRTLPDLQPDVSGHEVEIPVMVQEWQVVFRAEGADQHIDRFPHRHALAAQEPELAADFAAMSKPANSNRGRPESIPSICRRSDSTKSPA
ncbi:MAG: hypothetical protein U1F77_00655 [Kiritimatiellia bacterium]